MPLSEPMRLEVTAGAAVFYPLVYYLDDTGALAAAAPAVLFHELGHLIAAKACGAGVHTIRLEIPGLCMETDCLRDPGRELFCLAAGPAAGLGWALLAWMLNRFSVSRHVLAALIVNGFNLLPALPLDGGRLFQRLSGSDKAARISTGVCAGIFLFAAVRWRIWPCVLPVILFCRELLTACWHGAPPTPSFPAGRSAPGIPGGSGHSRSGSVRGKTAEI